MAASILESGPQLTTISHVPLRLLSHIDSEVQELGDRVGGEVRDEGRGALLQGEGERGRGIRGACTSTKQAALTAAAVLYPREK